MRRVPLSKNAVLRKDLPDARAFAEYVAHRVLARHLLEGARDDLLFDRGRHHDASVVVGHDEVPLRDRYAPDRNRAPDGNDLEAALRVGRRQPGGEDRALHVNDAPAVATEAVEHDSPTALGASVRAEELAPKRRARLALDCPDHHLSRPKTVKQVH